jgi:CelD/BcsL family acetyltransferase involved in cellulose biosynthesis
VRGRAERVVSLQLTDDAARWDRLVADHPGSTAFHDWEWLDFQDDLLGVRVERHLVVADGQPVGVFPLPRQQARWSPASPSLPFPFVGPLVPPALLPATARALRRYQVTRGLLVARFDIGPRDTTDAVAAGLRAEGLHCVEDSTIVLDTSHGSVDQLHANYRSARRRDVRRARKAGAEVRPPRPGELAALLPAVLQEAYEAHGVPSPYPADIGERLEAWARDRPWVIARVAAIGDELCGVLLMLTRHPTAVGWVGGSLRRFRAQSPNALLYESCLEAATLGGHSSVDFSGWVDDAIGTYKLGFGGERRPYLIVRSDLAPRYARPALARVAKLVRR